MRTPTGPAADVTYIGPRAFAIGFTLVCGIFVALFLGLDRLTELSEAAPASAESAQAVGFDPLTSAATAKSNAPSALPAAAPQALGQMAPVVSATPLTSANRTASTQSIQRASPSAVTEDPLVTTPRRASKQPIVVAPKPVATIQASVVAKPVASKQSRVATKPIASAQASVAGKPIASVHVLVAANPSLPLRNTGRVKSLTSMQSTGVRKPVAPVQFVAIRSPSALAKPPRSLMSVRITQPAVSAKPIVLAKQAAKPVKPFRLRLPPVIARASSPPLLVQFKPATASGQLDPRLVDHGTLLVTPTRPAFSAAVAPTPQPVAP